MHGGIVGLGYWVRGSGNWFNELMIVKVERKKKS